MKKVDRRNFIKDAGIAGMGAALGAVAVAGVKVEALVPPTDTPIDQYTNVQPYAYIIFRDDASAVWVAKNGTTGEVDYSDPDPATVLADVNTALATDGGTAYLKGPCDYGSITWTLSGQTAVIQDPTVAGLALASDGTWLGNVRTHPALKTHLTLTPNGPLDGGDFGPYSES